MSTAATNGPRRGLRSARRLVGRVPVAYRFWGVINYRGEVWPTSVSNHRYLAKIRFQTGWGRTWRRARRMGFRDCGKRRPNPQVAPNEKAHVPLADSGRRAESKP